MLVSYRKIQFCDIVDGSVVVVTFFLAHSRKGGISSGWGCIRVMRIGVGL